MTYALIVAWFGNHDCTNSPLLFADGKVLAGIGPSQRELPWPEPTTIGALRDAWGDPSVGRGLPADAKAWAFSHGMELVVAEVKLC